MGLFDFFKRNKEEKTERLDQGLEKTKTGIFSRLSKALLGKKTIDDEVLDEVEETLILADVGVDTTVKIITRIRERVAREKYVGTDQLNQLLRDEIARLMLENKSAALQDYNVPQPQQGGRAVPYVIMVVGVNGVGKTTTIGKLANQFHEAGHKVLLGAADTFRAAAVDQLGVWATRANVPIVDKGMGADPAAVAFEALQQAYNDHYDVVLIDTAGRLHNKKNLMAELSKIRRVMGKIVEDAPHEVLLVLDASTGQNAIQQAKEFTEATHVTALALTKLDGTAKGGVVIGIADQFQIPVKYIGVGEKIHDLQLFDPRSFVDSLFK